MRSSETLACRNIGDDGAIPLAIADNRLDLKWLELTVYVDNATVSTSMRSSVSWPRASARKMP